MRYRTRILLTGGVAIGTLAALYLATVFFLLEGVPIPPSEKARLAFAGFLLALASFAGFGLAVLRLARDLERRTDDLHRLAERVARGERVVPPAPGPDDEIGEVERAVARLLAARDRAEEEALARAREAEAGRLAAGIAHELGAPLTEVVSLAHLLVERARPEDRAFLSELSDLAAAAERARAILKRFLASARPSAVRPRPVVLAEVAEAARARLRRTLGASAPEIEVAEGEVGTPGEGPRRP